MQKEDTANTHTAVQQKPPTCSLLRVDVQHNLDI